MNSIADQIERADWWARMTGFTIHVYISVDPEDYVYHIGITDTVNIESWQKRGLNVHVLYTAKGSEDE